jgi:hypothetical protein
MDTPMQNRNIANNNFSENIVRSNVWDNVTNHYFFRKKLSAD